MSTEPSSLSLRTTPGKGKGVFAERDFAVGERILQFTGPVQTAAEITDEDHCIQIQGNPDLFLGPSGGLDDYVNHSCDPNTGLQEDSNGLHLVAIDSIKPGDELTFDYATCMYDDLWSMSCSCGSLHCRGTVGNFRNLVEPVRQKYLKLGVVPAFALGPKAK